MYAIHYTRVTGETGTFSMRYPTAYAAERAIRSIEARIMSDYKFDIIEIGNSAEITK